MSRVRMTAFYTVNALLDLIVVARFIMHAMGFGAPHEIQVAAHEAVSGATLLVAYALGQFANRRAGVEPVHTLLGYWEWAGIWALLMPLLGSLAALRAPGSMLVARIAGLGLALFGVASLISLGDASAVSAL